MDFWRHLGAGRLAELFGESEVSRDRFLRTLGWERIAQQELATLEAGDRAALEAYAQGVNAYLDDRPKHRISLEYTVLNFRQPHYQPADWQPLHTLTWPKVMAWDLDKHKLELELERARLLQDLSREQVEALFPPYPEDHPVILSQAAVGQTAQPGINPPLEELGNPDSTAAFSPALESRLQHPALDRALQTVEHRLASFQDLFPAVSGLGSNSWVVSGDRTATGAPLLANDPHLGPEIPSLWYEVGLHCQPQGPDCPYNVTGVSFAGVPGVIIGHSDRIAWGLTHVQADTLDLVIEKINPNNPNQYEVEGAWVDMDLVEETIQVAAGEPVSQTVRYTRQGPIISETYEPLTQFEQQAGIELPDQYAIALRWTALSPSTLFSSILQINRADDWQAFRQGAAAFDIVPHNLVYADVAGNIGYQMPGQIPIREQGLGRYPVPGWQNG
jgi:penicillin amidase